MYCSPRLDIFLESAVCNVSTILESKEWLDGEGSSDGDVCSSFLFLSSSNTQR